MLKYFRFISGVWVCSGCPERSEIFQVPPQIGAEDCLESANSNHKHPKKRSPILLLGPHRADTGAGMSIRKLAGFSIGEPSACPRPMPPR